MPRMHGGARGIGVSERKEKIGNRKMMLEAHTATAHTANKEIFLYIILDESDDVGVVNVFCRLALTQVRPFLFLEIKGE